MSKVTEDTQVYFVVGVKGLTEEVTASLYNELSDSRDMLLLNDLQVSLLLEITNNITNYRIIDPTGTETFAKGPKSAKLLLELKLMSVSCKKKTTGFRRM